MSEKITSKSSIEEIKKALEEEFGYQRQHGRAGQELEDPEAERKRLYNNYCSRKTRGTKRDLLKRKQKIFQKNMGSISFGEDQIDDITARRYKQCFDAQPDGCSPTRQYVKRMTGMNDNQITEAMRKWSEYGKVV